MVETVRSELPSPGAFGDLTPAQWSYLEFYGIRAPSGRYRFGSFESGRMILACQFALPSKKGRGTVIVVHGYLDHVGNMSHLVNHLIAEGYGVALYDQPGHGLSGGKRISTKDFSVYEQAFSDFLTLARSRMAPPYDVVAHSMGGTAVVDHLLVHPDSALRRVVLIAPMLRDATPRSVRRFGHAVSPLVDYLPRISENNSSDPIYRELIKDDPLQPRVVSTHWSRSFVRWQRLVENAPRSERSPLVLEAEIDTVIDVKYSHDWLGRIFPRSRDVLIEGGRHQLPNESKTVREQVFGLVSRELQR